jgi:O-antigen/teichoic acid export membrane protein
MSSTLEQPSPAEAPAAPPLGSSPKSRSARFFLALTIGYGYQAVVAVTGLVLTPLLLRLLGVEDYGQWLVIVQVLAILSLLDLGVTAVLPREIARASGAADGESVAELIQRAALLVRLQTLGVGLVAAGVWVGMAAARPDLSGPLAVILTAVVVQFPLRIPAAVLTGLQDLTFVAVVPAAVWAVTTVLSVGLVFAGWGLYALAVGWAAGQLLGCVACTLRLRAEFPEARAAGGWPGCSGLWRLLRSSLWVSLAQLAQLLTSGTDLLIAGWLLGPAAVVSYSCTTKLVVLLNNQCYSISLTAQPALAQLGASGDAGRLHAVLRAVGLALLAVSGAAAVAVAAVNQAFVAVWVGPNQYAGAPVTLLAVTAMTARHVAFTWWSAAYALGRERRLCGVLIADGVVTVAAVAGWTALLGTPGLPLGSLTGAVLIYLPTGLVALPRALGLPAAQVFGWLVPWLTRFAVVFGPVAVAVGTGAVESVWSAGGLAVAALGVYAVLAYGLAGREPLRAYRDRAAAAVRRKLGWLARATGTS